MSATETWRDEAAARAVRGDPPPRDGRRSLGVLPRPVHARRSCTDMAHAALYGLLDQACTTPRSRTGPARAPPRSPGSPNGYITARAATCAHWNGFATPALLRRPERRPDDAPPAPGNPEQGPLVEPTVRLLRDAGLIFRSRRAGVGGRRVQNFDLDILLRADQRRRGVRERRRRRNWDVTGLDLVAEAGSDAPQLRKHPSALGSAASRSPSRTTRPFRAPEDLAGLRVATSAHEPHEEASSRVAPFRSNVIPVSGATRARVGQQHRFRGEDLLDRSRRLAPRSGRSVRRLRPDPAHHAARRPGLRRPEMR